MVFITSDMIDKCSFMLKLFTQREPETLKIIFVFTLFDLNSIRIKTQNC